MADEFTIEKADPSSITVCHVVEGHRYTFNVAKRIGAKRYLSEEVILRETQLAWRSGPSYSRSARAFAEGEARKAGLID